MALFNFLPKEEQYFALFTQMTSYIFDASRVLKEMLADTSGDYTGHVAQIKSIEHSCDELTHSISTRLNKSFITPFDREDIYMLSAGLDDIVDLIDDSARAMAIYGVNESTPHARQFGDVIQRMAEQLHEVVSMLSRPNGISPRLVEIHRLENQGDDIYHAAIAKLFQNATDPIHVIKWKDIYEKLEATIDRCESVAHIIESIIIKHA
jgi:predicted phosphate transport protein (TIGR00153 family)